jgi:hypothetical protein
MFLPAIVTLLLRVRRQNPISETREGIQPSHMFAHDCVAKLDSLITPSTTIFLHTATLFTRLDFPLNKGGYFFKCTNLIPRWPCHIQSCSYHRRYLYQCHLQDRSIRSPRFYGANFCLGLVCGVFTFLLRWICEGLLFRNDSLSGQ